MTDFADMSTRDRDWRSYTDLGSNAVARKVAITGTGGGTDGSGVPNGSYDAAEFTVSTATTNYDVESNQSALWDDITSPAYVSFRTDQTVTIRLTDVTNPAITVAATDSPFAISNGLPITNIFVTNNSGSTANIKIFMY